MSCQEKKGKSEESRAGERGLNWESGEKGGKRGWCLLGTAVGQAPKPHGTPIPIQARLQTASHFPSRTNAVRQGGERATPRRQNRPLPLLKYLCVQRAATARWPADSQALLFQRLSHQAHVIFGFVA